MKYLSLTGILFSSLLLNFLFFKVLLHYSENGFLEFVIFDIFVRLSIIALPLIILIIKVSTETLKKNFIFDCISAVIGYYFMFFSLSHENLDNFDWEINKERREKIIKIIKKENDDFHSKKFLIPDSLALAPLTKSRYVYINHKKDSLIHVMFYTDRGLIDHYTAFVYTNDSVNINSLIEEGETRLSKNWFYVKK